MNIYCNGDSLTAGSEILDDRLPNFPGYHLSGSHLVDNVDKKWTKQRIIEGTKFYGSAEAYFQAQRDHAWPAQLKNIDTSLTIYNGAIDGASIVGIANRTILDLTANKNVTYDKIFIQLTGPYRFEFYNLASVHRKYMRESTMGWANIHENIYEKDIMLSYMKYYKDDEYSIKYLYTLVNLRYAIKGITGIEPIFLCGTKIWKDQICQIAHTNSIINSEIIIQLLRESGIENVIDDDIIENIMTKNNFYYMPGKHYELRCHIEFAKSIYERYIK